MDSKSKELINLFLMFKKINAHIANKKKWFFASYFCPDELIKNI